MNVLSLFAGIGGLDLGLERAGMTVVGQVEIDPFCQRVLAKHWPEVPRHDDVRTCVDWWRSESRPAVHVVAGGFPCQPVSNAGLKLADADPRWLWPEMAAVIQALAPEWVIGENVPGLRTRGLDVVLHDLRRLGYAARAGVVSACALGAPHARNRLFILAHANGLGCGWWDGGRRDADPADVPPAHGANGHAEAPGSGWWATEPDVGRVAHGVPDGLDRRRAIGNAVVPQVAEYIGRQVIAADRRSGVAA